MSFEWEDKGISLALEVTAITYVTRHVVARQLSLYENMKETRFSMNKDF